MNLTEKEIEEITFFSGKLMTEKEVSIITGVSEMNESFQKIYWREWYKTEALINDKIITLAQAGSSSAQALAIKIFEKKT